MKRTAPRMIINLNISDEEFEKQIELAVDKYVESVLDSCAGDKVNEAIKKYVDHKIDTVLKERRYDNASMIDGLSLSAYISKVARPKVEAAITEVITQSVSEALTNKFKV